MVNWLMIQDTKNSHHISLQALIFQEINNEWSQYLRFLVGTYFMVLTAFAFTVYILQIEKDFGRKIYVWFMNKTRFITVCSLQNINMTQKLPLQSSAECYYNCLIFVNCCSKKPLSRNKKLVQRNCTTDAKTRISMHMSELVWVAWTPPGAVL